MAALERMKEIGEWMRTYGETIYGTRAGDVPVQDWGVTTRKGDKLYVHVTSPEVADLHLPLTCKVKSATTYDGGEKVEFTTHKAKDGGGVTLHLLPSQLKYYKHLSDPSNVSEGIDNIIVLETK